MPAAATFSSFGRDAAALERAFAVDHGGNRGAEPVGYIFWTTDLAPDEFAYHGSDFHILRSGSTPRASSPARSWTTPARSSRTGRYFSVESGGWAAQFKGKSVFDRLRRWRQCRTSTPSRRASISIKSGTRAVRDSSYRAAAGAFLETLELRQRGLTRVP